MSAIALALALGCQPAAAEGARLFFEARGGWLSGDEQPWVFTTEDGQIHEIGASSVFGGTVGIVAPAGELFDGFTGWDVGLFARLGLTNQETGEFSSIFPETVVNLIGGYEPEDYTTAQAQHREYHGIIDLEARRPISLLQDHGASTILKFGARFAYFSAQTQTSFVYEPDPIYTLQDDRKSEFIGAGPRIAIETSIPLHERAWLDLGAGASLLFGQRYTTNVTIGDLGYLDETFTDTAWRLVPAFEARAALKLAMANSPATLSIGVEANAWFGVYDMLESFGPGNPAGEFNANRFEISPFINLSTPLGGDPFGAQSQPQVAQADTMAPVLELGLWGGGLWRSGDELNASSGPSDELEDFPLIGLNALAAFKLHEDWIMQAEIAGEARLGSDTTDGVAVDDTFNAGFSAGGQFAWTRGPLLFAAFAGAGHSDIATESPPSQDADHWFAGVQGRVMGKRHAFAVQIGHLATSADDPEVIDRALFGRIVAQAFFNDGRTKLQGDLAYASGEQDNDDFFYTTSVTVTSWGLEIEHQLNRRLASANLSAFFAYQGAYIDERNSFGENDTLTDTTVLAGLRLRTGATTPLERARATAPDMPNVVRWIGSVPAVD